MLLLLCTVPAKGLTTQPTVPMGEQSQTLEAIRGIFDEKVPQLIKEVKDRIAKNEVRTEAAHTRLDDHDARLERLESAGGSGSGEFIPKSIEFKRVL